MTAERLLRLYPRAWRERYGEEFLEFVGSGPLRPQQVIDIVSGAIDAHLTREIRRGVNGHDTGGGAVMLKTLKAACATTAPRVTTRDALIGAAVMIGVTFLLVALGGFARGWGWEGPAEVLTSLAFSVALAASMPFMYLKGQPRKVQVAVVVATFLMLGSAVFVASRI